MARAEAESDSLADIATVSNRHLAHQRQLHC